MDISVTQLLLAVGKKSGNCSLSHDEDTKSIQNSMSQDVLYVLSEAEYPGKKWKFNLDSNRKVSKQHVLEDN